MEIDALNRRIEVLIKVTIVQQVMIIILSVRVICLTVCPYRLCCVTDLDLKGRMRSVLFCLVACRISAVVPSSE